MNLKELNRILETIKSNTQPCEGHTDPNSIQDCWNEVFEGINDIENMIESLKNWNACEAEDHKRLIESDKRRIELEEALDPKHIDVWHEDCGDCLWWKFPIEEPPYCGTPLDCDFPDYVTHFTKLIEPLDI